MITRIESYDENIHRLKICPINSEFLKNEAKAPLYNNVD